MESYDETELELLCEYLAGQLSSAEEEAFEARMERDSKFRGRIRPVLRQCYKTEPLPMEIELGTRLAQRGLMQAPSKAPPRRRTRLRKGMKPGGRQS
jgi:anti-sigma-K factor RskA